MVQMPDLPSTLVRAFWDKQKAVLAKAAKVPSTTLGDELAKLAKLHVAVPWAAFGDDKLDSVDEAQERLADLEAAARSRIKELTEQTKTVETAAGKFETEAKKDSKFPKEPLAAATSIARASKDYRSKVDECVAIARKALASKVDALSVQQKKSTPASGTNAGAESKAAKFVRMRGLDAIRKIKKPAPDAKPMRFLIVQGKATVTTYMGPAAGPTQEKVLKSLIATEAPYHVFKDPQGELIWEKNAVTFVSDRLPAGLAKKMQLWLKKILKLNLRLRVRKTTGEAEETDGEDIPDDLLKVDPADAASLDELEADFEEGAPQPVADEPTFKGRLKAVLPLLAAAAAKKVAQEAKKGVQDAKRLVDEAQEYARQQTWGRAIALLEQAEELVGGKPAADYQRRLEAVEPRYLAALKVGTPDPGRLRAVFAFAQGHAETGNYTAASQALDKLEEMLGAAAAVPPSAKRASVPLRPVAPIWDTASEAAVEQTTALIIELRALGEPELDRMADDLLHTVEDHLASVSMLLDEFDSLTEEERTEVVPDALDQLLGEQRRVSGDRLIAAADGNPLGVRIHLNKTLTDALGEIASALRA